MITSYLFMILVDILIPFRFQKKLLGIYKGFLLNEKDLSLDKFQIFINFGYLKHNLVKTNVSVGVIIFNNLK